MHVLACFLIPYETVQHPGSLVRALPRLALRTELPGCIRPNTKHWTLTARPEKKRITSNDLKSAKEGYALVKNQAFPASQVMLPYETEKELILCHFRLVNFVAPEREQNSIL